MGKLITVAGNLGAGKTTLTRLLCTQGGFTPYWEVPEERPFQRAFSQDLSKYALHNQVDFLLFRCEQELQIRKDDQIAVMDGGLDQDFHVFTKNLHKKGHLNIEEFHLCERFYHFARSLLPPPDVIIRIIIGTPTLLHRRTNRVRETVDRSFNPQEFVDLDLLLDEWLTGEAVSRVIRLPFENELTTAAGEIKWLISQIGDALNSSPNEFENAIDVQRKQV